MPDIGKELSSINFGSIIGGSLNAIVEAQSQSAHTTVDFIKKVGFQPGNGKTPTEPIYVSFRYDKEVSPYKPSSVAKGRIEVVKGGSGYEEGTFIITDGTKEIPCEVNLVAGRISSVTVKDETATAVIQKIVIKPSAEGVKIPTSEAAAELRVAVTPAELEKPAEYRKMLLEVPILTMMPIPFIKVEEATIDFNVKINSVTTTSSSDTTDWKAGMEASAGYNGWLFKANVKLNASFSNKKTSNNSEEVKRDYSLAIHVKVVQDDMPAGMERLLDILDEATVSREAKTA